MAIPCPPELDKLLVLSEHQKQMHEATLKYFEESCELWAGQETSKISEEEMRLLRKEFVVTYDPRTRLPVKGL
jgi:hypothetical protein